MPENHVTVEGVKNLITEYDRMVVIPRESGIMQAHSTQHNENLARFGKIEGLLNEWKWPIRLLTGMVTAILLAVITLLIHNFLLGK